MCPHTAVAYLGLQSYFAENPDSEAHGIFLATAHPSKFLDIVEPALAISIELPANLALLAAREKKSIVIPPTFDALKSYLSHL